MSKTRLKDNKKNYDETISSLRKVKGRKVKVGIQGQDGGKKKEGTFSGATLVEIATIHEFGSDNVPERSFLRATIDANLAKYKLLNRRFMGLIVDGKLSKEKALGLIGQQIKSDMQKLIRSGIDPKLAKSTLEAKTRKDGKVADVALIETGQLIQSIREVVE